MPHFTGGQRMSFVFTRGICEGRRGAKKKPGDLYSRLLGIPADLLHKIIMLTGDG